MARPNGIVFPAQSRPPEELIARLRRAVCPVTMIEMLRRQWPYPRRRGLRLVDCRIDGVHRIRAKGFVIEYQLRLRGADGERIEQVFGELLLEEGEARFKQLVRRLRTSRQQLFRSTPTDLVAYVADLGLVLRFRGLDDRINGLRVLHKPRKMKPILLQHVVPAAVRVSGVKPEFLGHRPGKRCIVRYRFKEHKPDACKSARGSVIAKFYKARVRGRTVFAAMQRLWAGGFDGDSELRIPMPIAYLSDLRGVLMEDVPGTPLPNLTGADLLARTEAAGRILAKLHRNPLKVSVRHTVDDEIALLTERVNLVGDVHPALREEVRDALEKVSEALDICRDFEPALVHRDFYERQVLIDGQRAILIDFDTLCRSDPALDVGNFLANQRLAGLQGRDGAKALEAAFLAGYGNGQRPDVFDRVATYRDAAMLRLACLYTFRSHSTHVVKPLLDIIHGRQDVFP